MPRPGIPGTILATSAAALAVVALSACQTDRADDAVVDAEMDAQHEESDGDHELHWSYEADTGPAMWGSLDPSFAACDDGVRQSPVDIVGVATGGESELEIHWQPGDAEVVDNGHTIVVNVAEGSAITLEGREFALLQFHFHLPSEHTVEGSAAPMDAHFVHAAAEGDLAVIGVLMERPKPIRRSRAFGRRFRPSESRRERSRPSIRAHCCRKEAATTAIPVR